MIRHQDILKKQAKKLQKAIILQKDKDIVEKRMKGVTYREIGESLGLTRQAVYHRLKKYL